MANEQTTDAPLTAPVGEQLREKAHLDDVRAAEREPGEIVAQRVERKKAEERDAAQRHANAQPPGAASAARRAEQLRRAKRAAADLVRAGAGRPKWQLLLGGLALFGGLAVLRRLARR